jgi:hypothetical protein
MINKITLFNIKYNNYIYQYNFTLIKIVNINKEAI